MRLFITLVLLLSSNLVWSMFLRKQFSRPGSSAQLGSSTKTEPSAQLVPYHEPGVTGFICPDGNHYRIEKILEVLQLLINSNLIENPSAYGPFPYVEDKKKDRLLTGFGSVLNLGLEKLMSEKVDLEWPVEWINGDWSRNLSLSRLHYIVFTSKIKVVKVYYFNDERKKILCTPTTDKAVGFPYLQSLSIGDSK